LRFLQRSGRLPDPRASRCHIRGLRWDHRGNPAHGRRSACTTRVQEPDDVVCALYGDGVVARLERGPSVLEPSPGHLYVHPPIPRTLRGVERLRHAVKRGAAGRARGLWQRSPSLRLNSRTGDEDLQDLDAGPPLVSENSRFSIRPASSTGKESAQEWARPDLDWRPSGYQPDAPTRLSYGPVGSRKLVKRLKRSPSGRRNHRFESVRGPIRSVESI